MPMPATHLLRRPATRIGLGGLLLLVALLWSQALPNLALHGQAILDRGVQYLARRAQPQSASLLDKSRLEAFNRGNQERNFGLPLALPASQDYSLQALLKTPTQLDPKAQGYSPLLWLSDPKQNSPNPAAGVYWNHKKSILHFSSTIAGADLEQFQVKPGAWVHLLLSWQAQPGQWKLWINGQRADHALVVRQGQPMTPTQISFGQEPNGGPSNQVQVIHAALWNQGTKQLSAKLVFLKSLLLAKDWVIFCLSLPLFVLFLAGLASLLSGFVPSQASKQENHPPKLWPDLALGLGIFGFVLLYYWRFWWPEANNLLVFSNDTFAYSFWWYYFFQKSLELGREALWNPYVAMGYPAVSQFSNQNYPLFQILGWWFSSEPLGGVKNFQFYVISHHALAGLFAFAAGRVFGLARMGALAAALVYCFSVASLVTLDGFEWVYGLTWMPLSLLFLRLGLDQHKTWAWLGLGLAQAGLFSTNFMPGIYQEVIFLGVFFLLFWAPSPRGKFKSLLGFVSAQLLALALAAPGLFPLVEFILGNSTRQAPDYAFTMEGMRVGDLLSRFFYPFEFQRFLPAHFGFVTYLLLLVALLLPQARHQESKRLVGYGLFIFLFTSGSYLLVGDLLYLWLPGYGMQHWHFRATAYLGLPLGLMAGYALQSCLLPHPPKQDRKILIRFFLPLQMVALLALLGVRNSLQRVDLYAFLLLLSFAFVLWLWAQKRAQWAGLFVFALLLTELVFTHRLNLERVSAPMQGFVGRGIEIAYQNQADHEERYFETSWFNAIGDQYLFNRAVVHGYVTPMEKRVERFSLYGLRKSIWGSAQEISRFNPEFVAPEQQDLPGFVQLVQGPKVRLFNQAQGLPLAPSLPEKQRDLQTLDFMSQLDLGQTLALENPPPPGCPPEVQGKLEVKTFAGDAWQLVAENPGQGCSLWVFWLDAYHQGWQARLDDQEVPLLRADLAFKALELPPGRHEIRLQFSPASHRLGLWLRRTGLLMTLLLAGWFFKRARASKQPPEPAPRLQA